MTTITKRVTESSTQSNTKRVETFGTTPEVPPVFSNDTWGGTFSGWGLTWYNASAFEAAIQAEPAVDVTKRVTGSITENTTKRVTGV